MEPEGGALIWVLLASAIALAASLWVSSFRLTGSYLGDLGSWLSVVSIVLTAYTLISVQRLSHTMKSLVVVRDLRRKLKNRKGRLRTALNKKEWAKIVEMLPGIQILVKELSERIAGNSAKDAKTLYEEIGNARGEGDSSRGFNRADTILRLMESLDLSLEASEADSLWSKHG